MDIDNIFDFNTSPDFTSKMLAGLSDRELYAEFLFLDYVDSFECDFGWSQLWCGIDNYSLLVYYELAKRYLNGRKFSYE